MFAALPRTEIRGVELAHRESGAGPAVLLIHDTATDSSAWAPVASELGGAVRAIAYDRRGWGESGEPQEYARTTVEEQGEDAVELIAALGAAPALLCGAGLGAVIGLDVALRRPELVSGLVLIEPLLIALDAAATDALSGDGAALESAMAEGGRDAVLEAFLAGSLEALGPGAQRLPAELSRAARERPRALFAELGAATRWAMPLPRLGELRAPAAVIASAGSPELVRRVAAALPPLISAEAHLAPEAGPAHVDTPAYAAGVIGALCR